MLGTLNVVGEIDMLIGSLLKESSDGEEGRRGGLIVLEKRCSRKIPRGGDRPLMDIKDELDYISQKSWKSISNRGNSSCKVREARGTPATSGNHRQFGRNG